MMQPLKICFFVPFYPLIKGGAEYQSKIIAQELTRSGYEIVFISGGHLADTISEHEGFKVYELFVDNSAKEQMLLYQNYMAKVLKIIEQEAPNFIYQRILNTFTYRLSGYAKKQRIPFLLHIADNYSVEFTKGIRSLLKRYLFKQILGANPFIICQTSYQVAKIKEWSYEPSLKIPNMHPPIKEEVISRDMKRVVWIGNAREVKQLELFCKVAQDFKDSTLCFHVIGGVPENEYGHDLLIQMEECFNLEYHGRKDNVFINSFLQTAALLVNTSVSEGFSNTFIQAWMCGTPVVALNSDPDGFMNRYSLGINCEGKVEALKMGIESILKNKDYLTISAEIKKKAINLFSVTENVTKLTDLLRK
ncbi:glycosyltransferase [Maribacter sp. MJ134]|uniref:glycosyltransferase family 4 protein n=1 Tax=Maribacter sp. MJ134 TaxID=2496865 RepID=UPI000F81EA5E|nr:glycosyltransferase family 4 protein [Maribacter sp. MJ134]AZQ58485.1 glycosyltransferase [Maribacter sp. MJ134]